MSRYVLYVAALLLLINAIPHHSAHAADGWSEIGASNGRPSWVDATAERRLRLLPALPANDVELSSQVKAYLGTGGPGTSVGLVLPDGLFYSQGFGFADLFKQRQPDENTIFRAGSLSKVMTGTALLTLIDDPQRHISLDDDADKDGFLPELKFVCPVFREGCVRGNQHLGVKLKHLVSHTSGLPDVMETDHADDAQWLADLKQTWLLFGPGKYSSYSGVAVEGLGLIEQRISGKSYKDFVQQALFEPLGMTSSTMDPFGLPQKAVQRAQNWTVSISANAWSFTPLLVNLPGDHQAMLLPAGGLGTTVRDMSLFIRMWLSAKAPDVDGHPLLKPETIQSAGKPMFTATDAPLTYCSNPPHPNGVKDANGFGFSPCTIAEGFGVNWYVKDKPFIQHNGDEGFAGSNTVIDQDDRMGATALVSTEPFPSGKPQPAGLKSSFGNDVVFDMLKSGLAADKTTGWSNRTLAVGVARVLFLSGKTLQPNDLGNFMPSFIAAKGMKPANVVGYLTRYQEHYGRCSTFRVPKVTSATEINVRLACAKSELEIVLDVEQAAPHRISWTVIGGDPIQSPRDICTIGCNTADSICMGQAHSSGERQACVMTLNRCKAGCN